MAYIRFYQLGHVFEFLLELFDDIIRNLWGLLYEAIQCLATNVQKIHTIHTIIGMNGYFDCNLALEFAPTNGRNAEGLGPLGISEEIAEGCQDTGENRDGSNSRLGISFGYCIILRNETSNSEICRARKGGKNNNGNCHRHIESTKFLLGAVV
jgi:hypothetical protein